MKVISYLFRESWKQLALAGVCGAVSGISGAGLAKVIGDAVIGGGDRDTQAIVFFILCGTYLLTKVGTELCLLNITQASILRLRVELSRKLLATQYPKLQSIGRSELLAILTNDIGTFIHAFQALPIAFGNCVVILTCFAVLAWTSFSLFLVLFIMLVCSLVLYSLVERAPMRAMRRVRDHMDALYRDFRSLIDGTKELQLNAARGKTFVEQTITTDAIAFRKAFTQAMRGYIWVGNGGTMLFYILIGLLVFAIPLWMPQSAAVLTTFTLTFLFLMRPLSEIVTVLPSIRQAEVSLDRIRMLEGRLGEHGSAAGDTAGFASNGPFRLELRKVLHTYPSADEAHRFAVGPLDLEIEQGEILFVIGGNGSGKSTLAMLLLGFYMPDAGSVVLNGKAVTAANVDQYRQHFSAVLSDFHLFSQVSAQKDAALHARAAEYLARFDLAHKVKIVDGKFSTVELSSGQRKRLALIAAYLEDRPFYVFDEWAADQDPEFKRIFYKNVLPDLKARGKTVIAITHDDAYFSVADRVLKLSEGRIGSVADASLECA
jgi:putative ATP-binding cassette transporter